MTGTPCKIRRCMPLQHSKLYKARRYEEDRKTFNKMVTECSTIYANDEDHGIEDQSARWKPAEELN